MARLGVTFHDVARAADQLVEQGKQPTIELIRGVLGTGSSTTIANHLRQWRSDQDGPASLSKNEQLPIEFVSLMKGLWQRVLHHAEGQFEAAKTRLETELDDRQKSLEKYRSNNQRWQQLHNQWIQEKERLLNEKSFLEQGVTTSQQENHNLKTQLQEKQARIEELNKLHQQTQANLEHFRHASREQRLVEEARFQQQLQQKEIALHKAQEECNTLTKLQQRLTQQVESFTQEKTSLNTKVGVLEKKLEDFSQLTHQTQIELKERNKQYMQLEAHSKSLQTKLEELTTLQIEREKQLALINQAEIQARKEAQEYADRNKLLTVEKWELAQEKSQIEGQLTQLQKMLLKETA